MKRNKYIFNWKCKICHTKFETKESHGCMNKEADWIFIGKKKK